MQSIPVKNNKRRLNLNEGYSLKNINLTTAIQYPITMIYPPHIFTQCSQNN